MLSLFCCVLHSLRVGAQYVDIFMLSRFLISCSFSIQDSFHHFHLPSFLPPSFPSFFPPFSPSFLSLFCSIVFLSSHHLAVVDPAAAAAAVPTDPTAYYTDYWLYASYYGEAAARLYYTQWSPPEGTLPPPGTVLPPIDVRYATLYFLSCKTFDTTSTYAHARTHTYLLLDISSS